VGLNVHEKPFARQVTRDIDTFQEGMVFTLEPGLYYPDENLGVRIEDTLWIDDNGNFNVIAECPKDLVIPVKS
jgi:Xaa-Pro aminopeptidase